MPEAAKAHTAAGAEAFVKFYWEMVNYAQATGELDGLRSLGGDHCGACDGGLRFLVGAFKDGGSIHGGHNTVTRTDGAKVRGGSVVSYRVLATVKNTAELVDKPGESEDKRYPSGSLDLQFILTPLQAGWSISYWNEAST